MAKFPGNLFNSNTLPYFSTRSKYMAAILGGSVSVGSVIVAMNTVGLDLNRSFLQAGRNNTPIEPAPKLVMLLDKVATDLKLSDSEKKSVKIFCTQTDVSDTFGTVKLPYGALLGLPFVANAEDTAEYRLAIESEELDQDNNPHASKIINKIKKIKEVSVLSDAAKLFVIAEGLVLATAPDHFLIPAISTSACILAGCLQAALGIRFLRIQYQIPRTYTQIFYILSVVMWVGINLVVIDQSKEYLIGKAISSLSQEYIDGGIEYYEKLLRREKLKRDLYGVDLTGWFGNFYLQDLAQRRLASLRKMKEEFSWNC